jgi:hypothetical protein
VRLRLANCWAVRRGKLSPSPPRPPRRHRRRHRPPPPAASISSPPSSDGVGQAAATQGPPIPVQGQPIHDQAVHAPPSAASASHIDVGAAGHHLPPNRRHEARAPLTAAQAAVTACGGRRLRCRLRDPPSRLVATDVDATSETTTSGAFPPLGLKAVGRGHTPLAAWTDLLLHHSSSPPPQF